MDNSVVLSEYQAFPEVTAISIKNRKQLPVVTEILTTTLGVEMILTYCPTYPNPFTGEGNIHRQ